MFDSLIDEHSVHKAEQSNDVTCVVSGVPQYIDNHAAEIANFTIKLMQKIENFKVEDLTDLRIKLRIGIHTGRFVSMVVLISSCLNRVQHPSNLAKYYRYPRRQILHCFKKDKSDFWDHLSQAKIKSINGIQFSPRHTLKCPNHFHSQ